MRIGQNFEDRLGDGLDRLAERLRPWLLVWLAVSAPIWMVSYAWMLKNLLETAPLWVSIPVGFSAITAALGLAALLDIRQEHQIPPRDDQSGPHRRP